MTAVLRTTRHNGPVTYEPLLTTPEVAAMFRVSTECVARWAREGKIASVRTPGRRGHHRYSEAQVLAMLAWPGAS